MKSARIIQQIASEHRLFTRNNITRKLKKTKVKLDLKNLAMLPKLFWLYFCAPKTKSTSEARIMSET